MTTHILLIESDDLARSESLLSNLEQTGHQVCVVHTPSTAATKINTVWPNLIVFNLLNIQPGPSAYHEAISGTDLNIPYLIVGRGEHFPVETDAEVGVTSPSDAQQLTKAIEKVVSKQSNRFIRFPDLSICSLVMLIKFPAGNQLCKRSGKRIIWVIPVRLTFTFAGSEKKLNKTPAAPAT